MAGDVLTQAADVARTGLGWLARRGVSFWLSFTFALSFVPNQLWRSVGDRRDGVGYYSDPLGKPSLLSHWRGLAEFTFGSITLLPKASTDEALAAARVTASSARGPAGWEGDGVAVMDTGSYLEFLPPPEAQACGEGDTTSGNNHRVGVVIFPGALVPPSAYAPLARTMARKGYPSYILRFEFNLATKGWEATSEIVSRSAAAADGEGGAASCSAVGSRPTKWVLAGHSMGTVGIEMFYAENPESVDGVVYMGSGNMIGDAMKGSEVPAMVLRGSRDPFVPAEVQTARKKSVLSAVVLMTRSVDTFVVLRRLQDEPVQYVALQIPVVTFISVVRGLMSRCYLFALYVFALHLCSRLSLPFAQDESVQHVALRILL
ncbi:unnamed protein product [Ectocarpus sp. 4 AP-2014]